MRALHLSIRSPRTALAAVAGRWRPELRHGGVGSPLRLRSIPTPQRPPGWVLVRPTLAGICASDRKLLELTAMGRPAHAFYALPREGIVPGHEVVGRVEDADDHSDLRPGDLVVPHSMIGCTEKGFVPCRWCEQGDLHLCQHLADAGRLDRGPGFGFHARYGGGWSDAVVAPATAVHPVPAGLEPRAAVLAEPTAIGVHAVLADPPPQGARVAVIGPGAIGCTLTLALRALCPDVTVTLIGLDERTDEVSHRVGATDVLHGTRRALVAAAGELLDSRVLGSAISGPMLEDGFDVVYDVVGTPQTLDDALRMLRPRGTLVLLATASSVALDWTLVWHRELVLRGTVYYGHHDPGDRGTVGGGRRHAVAIALDLLAEASPIDLVTHVFPLDESVEALATAAAGPAAGAVKVAFDPAAG